jgi:hypothetical protein
MGLTAIRLRTFYWVSQIGMLPGTFVYVNAGSELARLTSPAGIFSPRLLLAFALLGLFPLAAKKTMGWYRRRTETRHDMTVSGPAVSRQAGDYSADDLAAEERSPHDPISPGEDLGCPGSRPLQTAAPIAARASRNAPSWPSTGAPEPSPAGSSRANVGPMPSSAACADCAAQCVPSGSHLPGCSWPCAEEPSKGTGSTSRATRRC